MSAPASSTLLGMLPIPRTRLIGRETERATGRAFVAEETVPLLTLTARLRWTDRDLITLSAA